MRFDTLDRLGVDHECDRQTDGQIGRRREGRMDIQNRR